MWNASRFDLSTICPPPRCSAFGAADLEPLLHPYFPETAVACKTMSKSRGFSISSSDNLAFRGVALFNPGCGLTRPVGFSCKREVCRVLTSAVSPELERGLILAEILLHSCSEIWHASLRSFSGWNSALDPTGNYVFRGTVTLIPLCKMFSILDLHPECNQTTRSIL